MAQLTVREDITDALMTGFGSCGTKVWTDVQPDKTLVYVGDKDHVITVLDNDMLFTDNFEDGTKAAVALDIRALLCTREMKNE